jgi:hypothetical protein
MATDILPAARSLLTEFNKSYGQSSVVEKIVAVIEKKFSGEW